MSRRGRKEGREEGRRRTDKREWKDRRDGKQGTARTEIKARNCYKKCAEVLNNTKTLNLQENLKNLKQ